MNPLAMAMDPQMLMMLMSMMGGQGGGLLQSPLFNDKSLYKHGAGALPVGFQLGKQGPLGGTPFQMGGLGLLGGMLG